MEQSLDIEAVIKKTMDISAKTDAKGSDKAARGLEILKKAFKTKADKSEPLQNDLLSQIREVCRLMDAVSSRFEIECDHDLIEACIYELEALRARYRYLLRIAKSQGVTSSNIEKNIFYY